MLVVGSEWRGLSPEVKPPGLTVCGEPVAARFLRLIRLVHSGRGLRNKL